MTTDGKDSDIKLYDDVRKVDGYRYPGEVRCVFTTRKGKTRYVVEATGKEYEEMLHIFSREQLMRVPKEHTPVAMKQDTKE